MVHASYEVATVEYCSKYMSSQISFAQCQPEELRAHGTEEMLGIMDPKVMWWHKLGLDLDHLFTYDGLASFLEEPTGGKMPT